MHAPITVIHIHVSIFITFKAGEDPLNNHTSPLIDRFFTSMAGDSINAEGITDSAEEREIAYDL